MRRDFSFGRLDRKIDQKPVKLIQPKEKTWREILKKRFSNHIAIIRGMSMNTDTNVYPDLAKDIYRGQISFLMSSYDHLIHQILFYKIIDIYNGEALETQQYKNIKISIDNLKRIINDPRDRVWLKREIEVQYGDSEQIEKKKNIFL